ncbi:MAG: ATP-binding protein [Gammaproteobacteria bacterium]|nr:ATP-binding protein [Gammaproteobacteria bacterium]
MSSEMMASVEPGQPLLSHETSVWRAALRQCAEQLESSAALLLRDREANLNIHAPTEAATGKSEPALAEVLQNIERVAGLCRLFGARRAAVFCADMAALFTQLVRTSDPIPTATLELAGVSLLQVTRFLMDLRPPVSDAEFDVATLNALRLAIGKSPLPPPRSGAPAVQDGPWNACHAPDIRALLLQRVRGAQAILGQTSGAVAPADELSSEIAPELSCELRAISSVLQVLGPQWFGFIDADDCLDAGQAVVLLLGLELQLSVSPCPSNCPSNCTSASPSAGRLPAVDCLLLDAQQQWRVLASQRLTTLVLPLAEAPLTQGAISERVGIEFLALCQSLQLAGDVELGLAPRDEWPLLLAAGVRLARHLLCWQRVAISMDGGISPTLAMRGRQLLLRLQLHALDCLSPENLPPTPAWRRQLTQTLIRDCQHFERLQRTVWRRRLAAEYSPDAELLCTFKEELRQTLILLERSLSCPQGDALCTVVARLAQNALVIGEVLLHEVLEAMRQLLTVLLERQASVGAEDLALLESLREQLLGRMHEQPSLAEEALVSLQALIGRRMAHLQAQPHADITDVLVDVTPATTLNAAAAMVAEKRMDGGRAAQTRVAITQLPVYLAQNIRELLSAAERLESRADFATLNRVLIVELRMLATGARALQVYRVARLSAVLAELHQALAVPMTAAAVIASDITADSSPDPDLLVQLVEAHRLLRRGLNQAAARREVDNPRDIIAGLYRRLDQWQTPPLLAATLASPLRGSESDWHFQHNAECYHDFRREAEELVESIESDLGALLSGAAGAVSALLPDKQHDKLQSILHALHTLKGNARLFACERLAALCHRCERALLAAKDAVRVQPGAVAEIDRAVHYSSGRGVQPHAGAFGQSRAGPLCPLGTLPQMAPLVSELRAALDELPLAASAPTVPLTPLPPEHSIAIPAASLQRIAALVGSARTQVRAALDVLQSCRHEPDAARLSLLEDLLIEQERCVVQLDEEVAGSRLVSFSRVTPRLQRLAGRHSNQLDRQLRLRVQNDSLLMDRLLLERLVAPLEHLLRNAIDHGIEPLSVRRACGKTDGGTVLLDMQERDDQLVLELRDDGAGISNDALLACAARLGMADSEEPPEQRLQWVLLPGFSTRTQATQDSGHGIGLAMVNSVVTALGGRVEVESTAGIGSCFRLLLPRWDIASKPV